MNEDDELQAQLKEINRSISKLKKEAETKAANARYVLDAP